jgi:uncharacterized protein YjbK
VVDSETLNREVEIKLEITEEVYRRIQASAGQSGVCRAQHNSFFDTADRVLAGENWAFRLRSEGERCCLTAKSLPKAGGGEVFDRQEYESELPALLAGAVSSGFSLCELDALPCRKLCSLFGDLILEKRFSFINYRTYIPFIRWTLELDKTEIGSRCFYELEAEASSREIDELRSRIREWFDREGWAYVPSATTKMMRAAAFLENSGA